MKKLIFTYFLLFAALGAFPQGPTLTSSNSAPQPGDSFTRYNADTTGVVPGDPGTGKIWDFSSLVLQTSYLTYNYVDPSTTPYGALFPDATVSYSNDPIYGYYKVTSSEYEIIGLSSSLNSWFYSNPEIMFSYPFSYGSNLVDSLYATSFYLGINHYRIGTRTTVADGYGTLILPSGTYDNMLRVKVIQNYSDSSSTKVVHVYGVTYSWYDGVNKTPAFMISTLSNTVDGTTTSVKMVNISSAVNGVADNKTRIEAIVLYPNPSNNKVSIILPDTWATIDNIISVYNTGGLLMSQQHIRNKSIELDISTLPGGIYIINITNDKNTMVSKLIKG
jgi:hypothetical protein